MAEMTVLALQVLLAQHWRGLARAPPTLQLSRPLPFLDFRRFGEFPGLEPRAVLVSKPSEVTPTLLNQINVMHNDNTTHCT